MSHVVLEGGESSPELVRCRSQPRACWSRSAGYPLSALDRVCRSRCSGGDVPGEWPLRPCQSSNGDKAGDVGGGRSAGSVRSGFRQVVHAPAHLQWLTVSLVALLLWTEVQGLGERRGSGSSHHAVQNPQHESGPHTGVCQARFGYLQEGPGQRRREGGTSLEWSLGFTWVFGWGDRRGARAERGFGGVCRRRASGCSCWWSRTWSIGTCEARCSSSSR